MKEGDDMSKIYEFTARSQNGKRMKGRMEANSKLTVIRNLQDNGYIPTQIEEKKEERPLFQRKVPLKELAMVCRQLSTMIRTGVPIIQALQTVKKQIKNKRFYGILDSVIRDLADGDTVAEAFHKHQQYFPLIFVKLLYAAEVSGNLDEVLYTLAESFQKDIKVRTKLRNAFSYPIFILLFAMIMITALIIFVLPTFVNMFKNTGAELPFLTKLLIGMNQFMMHNGVFLVIGLVCILWLLIHWGKTPEGKRKVDYLICHLPIIGDMVNKHVTFRFSQTLKDLQSSGVLIERSLQIVSEVITNSYYSERIRKVRDQVMKGSGIAASLEKSGIFSYVLVSMVRIGEESGELDVMLKDVSEFSQNELDQKISEITAFIEPLLLIIVGLFIGLAIMGILLPMYDGMMNIGK